MTGFSKGDDPYNLMNAEVEVDVSVEVLVDDVWERGNSMIEASPVEAESEKSSKSDELLSLAFIWLTGVSSMPVLIVLSKSGTEGKAPRVRSTIFLGGDVWSFLSAN